MSNPEIIPLNSRNKHNYKLVKVNDDLYKVDFTDSMFTRYLYSEIDNLTIDAIDPEDGPFIKVGSILEENNRKVASINKVGDDILIGFKE